MQPFDALSGTPSDIEQTVYFNPLSFRLLKTESHSYTCDPWFIDPGDVY